MASVVVVGDEEVVSRLDFSHVVSVVGLLRSMVSSAAEECVFAGG
jgi:hypothetical protein